MGVTLNFPRDVLRRRYFVPEASQHGAKLEIRTFMWLVNVYTKLDDTILDPMSGVGTVHMAAIIGRNTIAIELVPEFIEIQKASIEKMRQEAGLKGTVELLEGDCRRFLPLPIGRVDTIIFSPPYGDVMLGKSKKTLEVRPVAAGYSDQDANIGNIPVYPLYLEAMKEVYRLCNRSVRVGATMVIITKDYVKSQKRVYCSKDNIRLATEVGWELKDWHLRYTDPRIFQIISRQRRKESAVENPELDIDYEDLLVFSKVTDV